MTAGGRPTILVQLDNGTGAFPYDISSFVRVVDGINISRGRTDEVSDSDPGQCTLVLDNSDGRFTLGSTVIATPSPITIDNEIRVTYTTNATAFPRHTGAMISAPVAWPTGGDGEARVSVTLADAQAKGERRPLRSVIEEEILVDSPVAYYTLGEPAGSVNAFDSSGSQQTALGKLGTGTSYSFGSTTGAPATSGMTALAVPTGLGIASVLSAAMANALTAITLEFFYSGTDKPPGGSGDAYPILSASNAIQICVNETGKLVAFVVPGGSITSLTTVTDGLVHHIAVTHTGSTVTLYVDGVSEASSAITLPSLPAGWALRVGMGISDRSFGFVISNATVFSSALSAGRISAHSSAGSTGFGGERTDLRATRIAGYAGISIGTLDTGLTNVPFVDFAGQSAADATRDVVAAEVGTAYINGSGTLDFHNRNRAVSKTTPDATFDANFLAEDTSFAVDMQGVINYFEVTSQSTQVTQVVRNTVSELGDGTVTHPGHGRYPSSKTYLVQTDAEALDRGNWVVSNHAEPAPRVGTLVLDLFSMTTVQQAAALALEADSWVQIANLPSQTPGGTSADFVVQGIAGDNLTQTSWTLTLNVVSRSLFSPVWILGDSTYSVLGSTTRLFV